MICAARVVRRLGSINAHIASLFLLLLMPGGQYSLCIAMYVLVCVSVGNCCVLFGMCAFCVLPQCFCSLHVVFNVSCGARVVRRLGPSNIQVATFVCFVVLFVFDCAFLFFVRFVWCELCLFYVCSLCFGGRVSLFCVRCFVLVFALPVVWLLCCCCVRGFALRPDTVHI